MTQRSDSPMARTHYLIRTSNKGEPFLGRCALCGAENLRADAVSRHCDNPMGFSEEAVILAELGQLT